MARISNTGLLGAALIGVGFGIGAVGVALLIPAFTDWSMNALERAIERTRENLSAGVETAAEFAGHIASKAQQTFSEAAKSARKTTAKAAGAVESAARTVREYAS